MAKKPTFLPLKIFLMIFLKNRFALVCGKFIYVYFETNRELPSFRGITFYSKMSNEKGPSTIIVLQTIKNRCFFFKWVFAEKKTRGFFSGRVGFFKR